MTYVNETKAFAEIKKSERKIIYKADTDYWVSNGIFVFRTGNNQKLLGLGLIDYTGTPREDGVILKNLIDEAESANYIFKDTGFSAKISGNDKQTATILKNGLSHFIRLDSRYRGIFENCKFRATGTEETAPIFVYSPDQFVGVILPVRGKISVKEMLENVLNGDLNAD